MKKFLVVLVMVFVTATANAWNVADLNDNEQMALNCYGDHDMSVYFINENGLMEQYRQFAYIESFDETEGEK